jgi:nitrous oxide reductase
LIGSSDRFEISFNGTGGGHMNKRTQRLTSLATGVVLGLGAAGAAWSEDTLKDVMDRRGLTEKDLLAAAKTYVPTGGRDEYVVFSSGGQSGQVIVYGIPSMRILKYIGVFTPEPWQGYGFDDESKAVLAQGRTRGKDSSTATPTTRPSPRPTATTTQNISSSTTRPTRVSR